MPYMMITKMQRRCERIGPTRSPITLATAIDSVIGSAVFQESGTTEINTQCGVLRLLQQARESCMEQAKRLAAIPLHQGIAGHLP